MSFPESAPSANPVFSRTYSRQTPHGRESWNDVCDRTIQGLIKLGGFTPAEAELVDSQQRSLKCLTSGRWLWVGGTPWIEEHDNFPGSYNCSSTNVVDWDSFGLLMNLAMMGCGTGAVLEPQYINQLPRIVNRIEVTIVEEIGTNPERCPLSKIQEWGNSLLIEVGDSREGWVLAYQAMMEIASDLGFGGTVQLQIDLGNVRPAGERLKGFGGTSNPIKLPGLFQRCANILNKAVGRKLTAVECCLLIDEAALVVVAGSIRRSAGIRQFDPDDKEAALAKFGLWIQDDKGNWKIDPERDALRMANHTRVFHSKPSLETIIDSVQKQFYSGEGAIQYAPEAIARASADLLNDPELKSEFLGIYTSQGMGIAREWFMSRFGISQDDADDRLKRYGLNPCLRGDMKILTAEGYKSIGELAGQSVRLINADGVESEGKVWSSGVKQIVEVVLEDGRSLFCTPDHKWLTINLGSGIKKFTEFSADKKRSLFDTPLVVEVFEAKDLVGKHLRGLDESVLVVECKPAGEAEVFDFFEPLIHWGIVESFGCRNCGEIVMSNNTCNLAEVHLNQIDPKDLHAQKQAFQAGALSVAALLNHRFTVDRYQQSREADPIVGVSFTGLFDFFVHAFGPEWLQWWAEGRTDNWNIQSSDEGTHYHLSDYFRDSEVYYLMRWRRIVEQTVWKYCDRHGLKRPNRCTTVQPGGTKSLLTGASAGWHPPKAARFLRRITFSKNHPVALACLDYGYPIVPSQSDTDLDGNLLNDPFDDRCTEWLVEIPTETSWANLPGADQIDISRFSATAQFDFYMQVQRYYVGHNTSATLELREDEIEPLAEAIHAAIENNAGYISSALLARFDNLETFPRLPFEPISKEEYDRLHAEVLARRKSDDFDSLLAKYDRGDEGASGPAGCDSDKCLFPVQGKG